MTDTNPDPVKALLEACEPDEMRALKAFIENAPCACHPQVQCIRCTALENYNALSRAASVLREREGGEDYYLSHEALIDLVSLLGERDAIGGGPGFAERWKEAYDNACDLVRVEP